MHKQIPTAQKIQLDLIRHGEPIGGVRYRGWLDDPLSEKGWQQMQTATEHAIKAGANWNKIISSPLLRCYEFALQLSQQHSLPLSVDLNLKELNFGDLEGKTPAEAWDQYPDILAAMWENPKAHTPPNGEPYLQFLSRVEQALNAIIETETSERILLVIHGGVIRALLTLLINIAPKDSFHIEVPYAGITRLNLYCEPKKNPQASLVFLNRFHGEQP